MKKLIQNKLDKMDSLEQRKVLKNIVDGIFYNLIDYQEEMNTRLEDRAFNEIEDLEKNYDTYTTIVKREEVPLIDEFLFPILEEDKEEEVYDKQEIIDKLKEQEEVSVTKIFLPLSCKEIEELKERTRGFQGAIVSDEETYPISIELRQNQDYIKKEEELYKIFLENSTNWRTINNPYIRKMFDVVIAGYEMDNLDDLTDFEEISFDLGDFEDVKHINYVPVWNIEKVYQKGEGFPLPVEDKVNYDHYISLEALGKENGYLVTPNNAYISSVRKTEDELIITSDESNANPWELLKVNQNNKLENREFEFELMSNSRKETFMNKFLQERFKNIKTFGELNRLINSFEATTELIVEDIEIFDHEIDSDSTYDYNSFIEDEIRSDNTKKTMLLKFKGVRSDYFEDDLLSFAISELQMYFPEYLCKGEIV
ncbi:hypothetical protein [Selenihalanaerobacter shriftii]|uniref:Normocyte-binding protein n=1 Tax=Selenihalanaerobacter shriftii TaxID=142842 RepID=A0A1T4Q3G8_9FIRM|nr:hypothetical protein [Selenihalanaerobacter shriftii]SJZ97748.1 hypothetical protein SAMN02745118_02406 [Selenihalanaerobacter shriftii]